MNLFESIIQGRSTYTENLQYGGYDITITQSGATVRTQGGDFVQEFPTEKEAKEWIDEQNTLDEGCSNSKDKDKESKDEEDKLEESVNSDEAARELINIVKSGKSAFDFLANNGHRFNTGELVDIAKEFAYAYSDNLDSKELADYLSQALLDEELNESKLNEDIYGDTTEKMVQ